MRKSALSLAFVVVISLFLTNCFVIFNSPLSKKKLKLDKSIYGTWQMTMKFGSTIRKGHYKVSPHRGNQFVLLELPPEDKKRKSKKKKPMIGYLVEFDGQKYLHFYRLNKPRGGEQIIAVDIINKKEIKIRVFSPKKIKNLIEKNEIKGQAKKKSMLIKVTESSSGLQKMIKKHGLKALLDEKDFTLIKI